MYLFCRRVSCMGLHVTVCVLHVATIFVSHTLDRGFLMCEVTNKTATAPQNNDHKDNAHDVSIQESMTEQQLHKGARPGCRGCWKEMCVFYVKT